MFVVYKLNKEKNDQLEEQPITNEEEDITKEINLGVAEYDTINPLLSNNKQIQELTKIIYEPLLQLDSEYKIENCLAKDWAKVSEKMYLIKLDDTAECSCKNNCICPPGTKRKCTVRNQVPGSISFEPSVAGLIIAGEVIKDILNKETV